MQEGQGVTEAWRANVTLYAHSRAVHWTQEYDQEEGLRKD